MRVLFDVDNTLLDNDAVIGDLRDFLVRGAGAATADEYFRIFEALRAELGYADYLGTLQRYRQLHPYDSRLLGVSRFLVEYPFGARLYPGALEVLARTRAGAATGILTDGDVVFQPLKIGRAGLWDAVAGEVLICIHKEQELAAVAQRFPAAHTVVVDDKRRLLAAIKDAWGARVTTVWVRQGHYAAATDVERYRRADLEIGAIAEFTSIGADRLLAAAG